MNAIGKSAFSKVYQESNEKVPNGSTGINRDASTSSTLRDRAVVTVLKGNSLEKIAFLNENGKVSLYHFNCEPSPRMPMKQPEKGPCASKINNAEPKAESISTIEVPSGTTASGIDCNSNNALGQNPSAAVVSVQNPHPRNDTNTLPSVYSDHMTKESSSVPVNQRPDSKTPCTESDKGKMDENANDELPDGTTMSMGTNMEASNQSNGAEFSNQNSTADDLVGVGQKGDAATIEGTRELKAIAKKKRFQLKVKRKLLKGRAATSSLSSSIIFSSVFSVGKKNHKPRKRHSKRKASCSLKRPLCVKDLPSNTDQSLPEISSPPSDHFTHLKKKKKHSSDDKDKKLSTKSLSCNGSNPSDIVNTDFKDRSIPSGATTAADSRQGPGDSANHGWVSKQKDVMSMLTRGLEETIVAHWDDIGSALEKTEIRLAATNLQIGYIGDEWDEEYYKGKRKKVRYTKITYDEPNPFQQIASKNQKEIEQPSSENPPFRI